jgi:hypothetical protein
MSAKMPPTAHLVVCRIGALLPEVHPQRTPAEGIRIIESGNIKITVAGVILRDEPAYTYGSGILSGEIGIPLPKNISLPSGLSSVKVEGPPEMMVALAGYIVDSEREDFQKWAGWVFCGHDADAWNWLTMQIEKAKRTPTWEPWGSYGYEKRALSLDGLLSFERGWIVEYLSGWIWVAVTQNDGARIGMADSLENAQKAVLRALRKHFD